MPEPPHDENEDAFLQARIRDLRETLNALAGGKAIFGEQTKDMPPEMELAFLERVLAFETAGSTTWLKRLEEKGYFMPPPESLTDDEIGLELWQVIQHLAELRVFLYNTNHLSDHELYNELYRRVLSETTFDIELDGDSTCHIDPIGSSSDEDLQTWFRYYAGEEERRDWMERFPDDPLPPHEEPPYDRDRLLPQRELSEEDPVENAIQALLSFADWRETDGPLRLNNQIEASNFADAPIFFNCRVLLETLREVGRAKATAQLGDLPRAFNRKVNDQLPQHLDDVLPLALRDNTNNERSIARVHQARLICQSAGLLRKQRGHFMLTRKGESLLAPPKAGQLYRDLFLALFRRLNLAYFDGMPALPSLQQTLAITLWRLSIVARHWTDLEALPEELLLPTVVDDLYDATAKYRSAERILNTRLVRPLKGFGLVETINEKKDYFSQAKAVRITPLFDRFISFHLEG